MTLSKTYKHRLGFTLLEIIAVLVILGILATVTVQRYIKLEENNYRHAIDAAVSELNSRESRIWSKVIALSSGWTSDSNIWSEMTQNRNGSTDCGYPDLGEDYRWIGNKANRNGESYLSYKKGNPVRLVRIPSTEKIPARWKIKVIKKGEK